MYLGDMELLSCEQAAARLGVSDTTVRTWCQTGLVTASRRPGKRRAWLIPMSEVERLLAEAQR
jgi:excisionase family DNA binding protein